MKWMLAIACATACAAAIALPAGASAERSLASLVSIKDGGDVKESYVELGQSDDDVCALAGYGEEVEPSDLRILHFPAARVGVGYATKGALAVVVVWNSRNGTANAVFVCPPARD